MKTSPSICVVGVGNLDCGDDGAGLRVIDRIERTNRPAVKTMKASGEPADLIETFSQHGRMILIDAIATYSKPGTIHRFDVTNTPLPSEIFSNYSTHGLGVDQAIEMARVLGDLPDKIIVYGIEGMNFEPGDSVSPEVNISIDKLALRISAEIDLLQTEDSST